MAKAKDIVERARREGVLRDSTAAMVEAATDSAAGSTAGSGGVAGSSSSDGGDAIDENWPEADEAAFPPGASVFVK